MGIASTHCQAQKLGSKSMIPKIIHHISKDSNFSRRNQSLRSTWKEWNKDFEFILWDDNSLRNLISERENNYLKFFDNYIHGICRADLGRYILMKHFGGIYVDLDCQCLRPIDELIKDKELILAPEPESHTQQKNVINRQLKQIICPSFIASKPMHPFWNDVLSTIAEYPAELIEDTDDVLDATGPFMLSRVVSENQNYQNLVLPAKLLYPLDKNECWSGLAFDPIYWMQATKSAYNAHYWDGTWFRKQLDIYEGVPLSAPVEVIDPQTKNCSPPVLNKQDQVDGENTLPLVSCLMVTRNRFAQAQLAVQCFLSQTYPNKELIIIDDDPDDALFLWSQRLNEACITHCRLENKGLTLGELRNLSVEIAKGDLVCQWDDDDLYDPVRLEFQISVLLHQECHASILSRVLIWWPAGERLSVSCYRNWEGSMILYKELMPKYKQLRRGEDTQLLNSMRNKIKIAKMDLPRSYIYIYHSKNTWNSEHFDQHWGAASQSWSGQEARRLLSELNRRVPISDYKKCL